MLLFTGDILQGVLLRTEWTVTSNNLFAQMNNIVVRKEGFCYNKTEEIGDGILACMSRDSEIFMSKHLAV